MIAALIDKATSNLSPSAYIRIRALYRLLQNLMDLTNEIVRIPCAAKSRIRGICGSAFRRQPTVEDSCRLFGYNTSLLPNQYIAQLDSDIRSLDGAKISTGLSLGFPSWCLIYYSLLCSLRDKTDEIVVVETGTNRGITTIILAQALMDAKVKGRVYTVDIDAQVVEMARRNIEAAGVQPLIDLNVGDSLQFLKEKIRSVTHIDFAYLDGSHSYRSVLEEFSLIYPKVRACKGMVYFDNTRYQPIKRALRSIHRLYGGHIVQFDNCSWGPPGNAIWQPKLF